MEAMPTRGGEVTAIREVTREGMVVVVVVVVVVSVVVVTLIEEGMIMDRGEEVVVVVAVVMVTVIRGGQVVEEGMTLEGIEDMGEITGTTGGMVEGCILRVVTIVVSRLVQGDLDRKCFFGLINEHHSSLCLWMMFALLATVAS